MKPTWKLLTGYFTLFFTLRFQNPVRYTTSQFCCYIFVQNTCHVFQLHEIYTWTSKFAYSICFKLKSFQHLNWEFILKFKLKFKIPFLSCSIPFQVATGGDSTVSYVYPSLFHPPRSRFSFQEATSSMEYKRQAINKTWSQSIGW